LQYVDYLTNKHTSTQTLELSTLDKNYYSGTAVRKAILLTRYVSLLKHWIRDTSIDQTNPSVSEIDGIPIPSVTAPEPLTSQKKVSAHYRTIFQKFISHIEQESDQLHDEKLSDLQEKLSALSVSFTSKDVSDQLHKHFTTEMVVQGDGVDPEEACKTIAKELGKLSSSHEEMVSSFLTKLAYDHIDKHLYSLIDKDKTKILQISENDIADLIEKSYGKHTKELLNTTLTLLHTRFKNYIVFDYIYNSAKKANPPVKETLEKEWGITLTKDHTKFLSVMVDFPNLELPALISKV